MIWASSLQNILTHLQQICESSSLADQECLVLWQEGNLSGRIRWDWGDSTGLTSFSAHTHLILCFEFTLLSERHCTVWADLLCVCVPLQGVWAMEGQQPGGGEAGEPGRLRRPGSAPRSRLPARRPPAGEAAKPPDDYRESNQEIWNPPPRLRHSGRYSRECAQLHSSPHSCLLQIGLGFVLFWVFFFLRRVPILPSAAFGTTKNTVIFCSGLVRFGSQTLKLLWFCVQKTHKQK